MRVAALGRTRWLSASIEALAHRGHEIVLIGTCMASPEYDVREADFARLAEELGSPFFVGSRLEEARPRTLLEACGAEVGISVNWPTLIGDAILSTLVHGFLNGHPGDLPRYRGNAAPNWAMIAGEDKVVATVHRMVAQLDAGAILASRALPLTDETYIGDVYCFLDAAFPELFVEAVEGLAASTVVERQQPDDPRLSLRGFPRRPVDSELDWRRPAPELARLVRASAEPFAGAFTHLGGRRLTVWRARAEAIPYPWLGTPGQVIEIRRESGEIAVLTGEGALVLELVELEGAGRVRPTDVVISTRTRLGQDTAERLDALALRVEELEARLRRDC